MEHFTFYMLLYSFGTENPYTKIIMRTTSGSNYQLGDNKQIDKSRKVAI
jgi:hypothetical protein